MPPSTRYWPSLRQSDRDMVDSHVHIPAEQPLEYARMLVQRMEEHGIGACIVFGSQCSQATSDEVILEIAGESGQRLLPFLSSTLTFSEPGALETCFSALRQGPWRGVGEIFLDCTDDADIVWTDKDGTLRRDTKPVPAEKENNPLYRGIFQYCGEAGLPVLVHCMDSKVMARTLRTFPQTTFIWAHADHGFYCDVALDLLAEFPNLICEFGVEFRFHAGEIVSGTVADSLGKHIGRWRRTCAAYPDRVVWGSDLYSWKDLQARTFRTAIEACNCVVSPLSRRTRRHVLNDNILSLIH